MEAPGVLLLGALVSLPCRVEKLEVGLDGFLCPLPPAFIELWSVLRQGRRILFPFPVPSRGSQPQRGRDGDPLPCEVAAAPEFGLDPYYHFQPCA